MDLKGVSEGGLMNRNDIFSNLNKDFWWLNWDKWKRPDEDEGQEEKAVAQHGEGQRFSAFVDQGPKEQIAHHVAAAKDLKV